MTNKLLLVMLSFVIGLLIVDTSANRIMRFLGISLSTDVTLLLFYVLAVIYLAALVLVLKLMKSNLGELFPEGHTKFTTTLRIVTFVQYGLAGLLAVIILEMFLTNNYHPHLARVIVSISYLQSFFFIGFLAYKFILWFRATRSHVLMFYTLAVGSLFIHAIFTFLHLNASFDEYVDYLGPGTVAFVPTPASWLILGFQVTSILSYIFVWIASVIVLRDHSYKFGKLGYWTAVGLPIVYFAFQFSPLILQLFAEYRISEPVLFGLYYTIIFGISQPIGGIFFGYAFWTAGRKIDNQRINNFLLLSAVGIILFFTSNQPIILSGLLYPPFGLITNSFLGVASYVLFLGVYFIAISINQDVAIRRMIKRSLKESTSLLGTIAASEMHQQISKKIVKLRGELSEQLDQDVTIDPTLSSDDVKNYIDEVLKEIKKGDEE